MTLTVAQLLVKCLEQQGVTTIFGIPGAKIDAVFNALEDSAIRLIVCRHEQNAAFMAAAYGRLTGNPGVVLVTSGPGVTNLATGLLTATTEGDPVIAIAGNVARSIHFQGSHQEAENVNLLKSATKLALEVDHVNCVAEQVANAFRVAGMPRRGACLLSFPQDLLAEKTNHQPIVTNMLPTYGVTLPVIMTEVVKRLNAAKSPILLLGEEASEPMAACAINQLLLKHPTLVVSTYQAAGVVGHESLSCFVGRVGLFANQPGDIALQHADLILTIGFNQVEYDPGVWHQDSQTPIIHLNYYPAKICYHYVPCCEVLGDIANNLKLLTDQLPQKTTLTTTDLIKHSQEQYFATIKSGETVIAASNKIHPLAFIHHLRAAIDDDAYVICDVGSVYMWVARYFLSYRPRHLLFSNGQQTLGIGLPFAMATRLVNPKAEIISLSGDGGFLFSAMELETAVREQLKIIHFIWSDGTYNMVKIQEEMKYERCSGVMLGSLDIVSFANAFGATGYKLTAIDNFTSVLAAARQAPGPVLIDVAIDYKDNDELIKLQDPHDGH